MKNVVETEALNLFVEIKINSFIRLHNHVFEIFLDASSFVSSALSSKWRTDEHDNGPFLSDLERKRINLPKVTLNRL